MHGSPRVVLTRVARRWLGRRRYAALREAYRRRFAAHRAYCAVCEAAIPGFVPNSFGELMCPSCDAFPRTRAAMLYLRPLLANGRRHRVLNFAPHAAKEAQLAALDGISYVTADHPYAGRLYQSRCMLQMDLEQLPCNDASFDVIVAIGVVQFVLRDERMFREIARVLAPGGRFVFETTIFGAETVECYSRDELETLVLGEKPVLDGLLVTTKWRPQGRLTHDPRQYVRKYGLDIEARVRAAGLTVNPTTFATLCASAGRTADACGLAESAHHLLFVCEKP